MGLRKGLIALAMVLGQFAFAQAPPPYCLALRGNGELAPAHWGALAQVVERLGLPQAMAGGSSATINLFLLESISLNPAVKNATTPDQRRVRASFLLKSLQEFLDHVVEDPQWRDVRALMAYLKSQTDAEDMPFMEWLTRIIQTSPDALLDLVTKNWDRIEHTLKKAIEVGLVDPSSFAPLFKALIELQEAQTQPDREWAQARAVFYAQEIQSSINGIGKFNAQTDDNLFFRSGFINFERFAATLGRIASFYAGRDMSTALINQTSAFVNTCAPLSLRKTWSQLIEEKPECETRFRALLDSYLKAGLPKKSNREDDSIGEYIPTLPATAVIQGPSVQIVKSLFEEYEHKLSPTFGAEFTINNEDLGFGYWGRQEDLRRVESGLKSPFRDGLDRNFDFRHDAKSLRFTALGETDWKSVLSLSPAEPGLAPLKEFRSENQMVYYSAGGWGDLHPVAVLKALGGCDHVVYVTRRGGESMFAQGIAKRLLGLSSPDWDSLNDKIRNNQGDGNDLGDSASAWSSLYNLANPNSSFNLALKSADAVFCTDWNQFDVTQPGQLPAMIGEAYRAPWAMSQLNTPLAREATRRGWRLALPEDNDVDPRLGYRPYSGCLPF